MVESPLRVTVWNEGRHETTKLFAGDMDSYYPDGIHGALKAGLEEQLPGVQVRTALLDDPEHGLPQEVVDGTDVLLWWGHMAHEEVSDEIVERVHEAVLGGMGLVVLHSGHHSNIFRTLMGTTCSLLWRNVGERELVWTVNPAHPIAKGVPSPIIVPKQEMYGEPFDIPTPDELIFVSSFDGGEIFRSGATWTRGRGRIFYFSPGDQEYPVYNQPEIRRVIANGVEWSAQPGVDRTIMKRPSIADIDLSNIPEDLLSGAKVGWFLPEKG